jgi:hypothetical protein
MLSIKIIYRFAASAALSLSHFFRFRPFQFFKLYFNFLKDYFSLNKGLKNPNFEKNIPSVIPELFDKTSSTSIEPIYFYQSAWCASKVFKTNPKHHYDVGSSVNMLGMISQFVPVTMIDIRPPDVNLPSLGFKYGTILGLPFLDNSISSLSSICVIEHIGLGRYGDPIDSFGSEKAINELKRVLSVGGNLFITVPIFSSNKIYFNAHRAFEPQYFKSLFQGFELKEELYQYQNYEPSLYEEEKGFGTGYFHFVKY